MILFRYISKNLLTPFILSLFTLMSVFLLNFLMKIADKLIGKGLSFIVISKLVIYSLSWMFVLAVPMAVLIATLMAFGSMAQNNEIAIMKASGISLYKMMIPPVVGSILIAFLLVQFNNNVYPEANHALRVLTQDISNQKPTLSLVPGVFSSEIPRYSLLAREIDSETNKMKDITIYDNSNIQDHNVVTAKRGEIYFSSDRRKLILNLFDGEIHTSKTNDLKPYRKLRFENHKIAMEADQFSLRESALGGRRGDRELGAQAILVLADSVENLYDLDIKRFKSRVFEDFIKDSIKINNSEYRKSNFKISLYRVEDRIRAAKNSLSPILRRVENYKKRINKYWVEVHKKYSIPFACIVFVLIGAPLGTMTRKGGFGVAAGISLGFFLIYWAFLIGGEKLSDRDMLSPFWGMWSANILLGILGIILVRKSARERIELNFDFIKKYIPKRWRGNSETA
ncbi:MAG: LptF/LptG family permease [Melioribacteraceae bacterium]|nr:LptF/LptG family permease [Melioribacteraceae bacterium]